MSDKDEDSELLLVIKDVGMGFFVIALILLPFFLVGMIAMLFGGGPPPY